jgi:hypothetical protein
VSKHGSRTRLGIWWADVPVRVRMPSPLRIASPYIPQGTLNRIWRYAASVGPWRGRMADTRKRRDNPSSTAADSTQQSERFVEAARALGADQSEEAFAETLRKIAEAPPQHREPKKPR